MSEHDDDPFAVAIQPLYPGRPIRVVLWDEGGWVEGYDEEDRPDAAAYLSVEDAERLRDQLDEAIARTAGSGR